MAVWAIDVKICGTAYIRAESEQQAWDLAHELTNGSPAIPGSEGDVPISGLMLNDPDLPQVSLSPAMTIDGIWDTAVMELMDEEDDDSAGGWFIKRNGSLYARRETLGEARACVSNAQRIAGDADEWQILDGDGTAVPPHYTKE